jgi:hypothetical protein
MSVDSILPLSKDFLAPAPRDECPNVTEVGRKSLRNHKSEEGRRWLE